MGLIKTPIMTGGGLYAVNRIAKTAERRNDNHQPHNNQRDYQAYPRDSGPQDQGSWGALSPPRDAYQGSSREQYPRYPPNESAGRYAPPPPNYNPQDYENEKPIYYNADYQYQPTWDGRPSDPRSYYPRQQGYPGPSQDQGCDDGGGRSSALNGLAGMAMGLVTNGNSSGKGNKQMDKGVQMASQLFGR